MTTPSDKALAQLGITSPDGSQQVQPVTKSPFNIGRIAGNDLILGHQSISRQHARLLVEGDQISLIDLNSSNGTFVGDVRLAPNTPRRLEFGEFFRIGPFLLTLQPAPASTPPQVKHEPGAAASAPSHEGPGLVPVPPVPVGEPVPERPTRGVVLGTRDLPVVNAPTPAPQPKNGDGHLPAYGRVFGLPPDASRYLAYLPPIYQDDNFLARFLLAFEAVWTPIEQTVDHFDLYLDPRTAPTFFLDVLGGWLALTLDEKWPPDKRRMLVAEAAELYRRRGTRWALTRHIEIYAGVKPEIVEPPGRSHFFEVTVRVPPGAALDRDTMDRIIQANRPVHTTYSLQVLPAGLTPPGGEKKQP